MDGVRIKKMSGSKAPDYDTYGLLRTTCSHNPTQHSHIMVSDLLTLVSLKIT